jgi:hypothetical protein
MVSYRYDSTTLWSVWDPAFRVLTSQSDVIFAEERNVHSPCQHGDQTDLFELPEETEYVEEIETGRYRLIYDRAGTSRTGEGHGSGDYD